MANPKTDGRMIRKKIADSGDFASLSPEAAVLFCMILPHLDTHGKLQGGPAFIKEIVCPKVKYLTIDNIPALLVEISIHTDMKWFRHDERYWIHAIHFNDHQKLDQNKIGRDLLPTYSEVSQELVAHKDKEEVEVKVGVKEGLVATASPSEIYQLPTKEQIQEASDPMILSQIEQICGQLYQDKIFPEVNAFKNKMLKAKKNPRSILHTLCRAYMKHDFEEGPWAYCQKIIEIESQTYNARDYAKTV